MGERRRVRLFRSGGHQVVRIPVAFELPGDEAIMHRDGERLVIETVRKRGLVALLASMTPIGEDFAEIEDQVPAPEGQAHHHQQERRNQAMGSLRPSRSR